MSAAPLNLLVNTGCCVTPQCKDISVSTPIPREIGNYRQHGPVGRDLPIMHMQQPEIGVHVSDPVDFIQQRFATVLFVITTAA